MLGWIKQLLAPTPQPKPATSMPTALATLKVGAVFPQVAIPLKGLARRGSGEAISAWLHEGWMWLVHSDLDGLRLIQFDLMGQPEREWSLSDPGPAVGAD